MQDKRVLAFRQRMAHRGYTAVSVREIDNGFFLVRAFEPFSGSMVERQCSVDELSGLFRSKVSYYEKALKTSSLC